MPVDKHIKQIFRQTEILSVENFYKFSEKKKITVFVPLNFIEKVSMKMWQAGAGKIGNYEMCSFRSNGTGTFKPNKKAKPFAGEKNVLAISEEVKLEMVSEVENLNIIIDKMIDTHPYEEVAYEISDFRKREEKKAGCIVTLKNEMKYLKLLKKLNSEILVDDNSLGGTFKSIVLTSRKFDEINSSAKFISADCILIFSEKKIKLYKYKYD